MGGSFDSLLAVARETGASAVYWNRLYDPALESRDARIKAGLRDAGISCESFNAALLHEPWEISTAGGQPYRVFTPYWRTCLQQLDRLPRPIAAPVTVPPPRPFPATCALADFKLSPRIRWDSGLAAAWTPGEAGALERLDAFVSGPLRDYTTGRDRPDRPGTSRLSPHLHFGEVGPRQCVAAVRNAVADDPSARGSAEGFVRELGWREFAHHLLHHFRETPLRPLDKRFDAFPWSPHPDRLEAWQRGRTGFPIVDAGMRELWSTGWMHNRVRMICASLLTKNLMQPWQDGARWFWDTLVDADLANNTLGWQWTAGCGADAAPFFRIFNPALQAEKFDPDRSYLRRWLPELASLPDTYIHRPWSAPATIMADAGVVLGQTYPRPVVDLAASRRQALAAYSGLRAASR